MTVALLALMTMTTDPSLVLDAGTPRMTVLPKATVGTVSFEVQVHNPTAEPAELRPAPLSVEQGSRALAQCPYSRAIVAETAGERRRFTTFKGPLAPGERVKLRLFFTWPKGVPAPRGTLRYVLTVPTEKGPATVRSRPFEPQTTDGI